MEILRFVFEFFDDALINFGFIVIVPQHFFDAGPCFMLESGNSKRALEKAGAFVQCGEFRTPGPKQVSFCWHEVLLRIEPLGAIVSPEKGIRAKFGGKTSLAANA